MNQREQAVVERNWLKVQCERCGKTEVFRLTEEQELKLRELGGVISLAFDHGDHVMVVAIDVNHDIRGQYLYEKAKVEVSIPVAKTIDTSKPKYQVEYLMAKASKWINFFLKESESKKAKVIGNMTESEIEYIKKVALSTRGVKEETNFDIVLLERDLEKKNIIIVVTGRGDIFAGIVRSGIKEDVDYTRKILLDLVSDHIES